MLGQVPLRCNHQVGAFLVLWLPSWARPGPVLSSGAANQDSPTRWHPWRGALCLVSFPAEGRLTLTCGGQAHAGDLREAVLGGTDGF